ncbi:MAG: serine/alanine adding enzyme [Oleiphilaceae bacterium]|jgi:serine/alanine adding enzyme
MNESTLDLRHPELFLTNASKPSNNSQLQSAIDLGKKFREAKRALKIHSESKKQLAKSFRIVKDDPDLIKQHNLDVKQLCDKIKQAKTRLKNLETEIRSLVTPEPIDPPPLPAQFMPRISKTESTDQALKIAQLTTHNQQQWTRYVEQHPNATIYHSLTIKKVIEQTFNHKTLYLMAVDKNDEVRGVLPLTQLKSRLFGDLYCAVPFFNYGGVLADNDSIETQLINHAWLTASTYGSQHIEYRQTHKLSDLPCRDDKVSMILELPEHKECLWQNLGSKLRAQINKAAAHTHQVKIGKLELVDDFYQVFAQRMRDLGTPVYSKKLFINMLKQNASASIVVIYVKNRAASAGFILGWRNTLEIPWASSIKDANNQDNNMLLYWHILQFAIEQKYECFDFGRSSKDASTYKFKKQWGAKEYPLYWHYSLNEQDEIPSITTHNPKYQLAITIWKILPIWLTKIIGPHIVKYIP